MILTYSVPRESTMHDLIILHITWLKDHQRDDPVSVRFQNYERIYRCDITYPFSILSGSPVTTLIDTHISYETQNYRYTNYFSSVILGRKWECIMWRSGCIIYTNFSLALVYRPCARWDALRVCVNTIGLQLTHTVFSSVEVTPWLILFTSSIEWNSDAYTDISAKVIPTYM